jgi:hypothetical protein
MSADNLLTVAEYADAKRITKQAVYKQLNNRLKEFLVVVDGKKYIDKAALGDSEKTDSTEVKQDSTEVEQPLNNQIQPWLQAQIEEKDKTIESLLRQVETLTQQNATLTDLLHNSQVLLAAEKQEKQQQLLMSNTESEEQPIETTEKRGIFSLFKRKGKKM